MIERLAGGSHRSIDVLLAGVGDANENLFSGS
jgi:hypothetical protein